VLGTDGASETSDADGTEFGRDRVIEYVRRHASDTAHEIATGVYRAARSFGASEPQHDDITAVIVKVTAAALRVEKTSLPLETVAV
jgi:sigma-B regulation protein RsbU (phosphoserine phosphatase)